MLHYIGASLKLHKLWHSATTVWYTTSSLGSCGYILTYTVIQSLFLWTK